MTVMLKLVEMPAAEAEPCPAAILRGELDGVVSALTRRFDATGVVLVEAVAAIDEVVKALRDVASVFDTGAAASAVDDLMIAAEDLRMVAMHADARACSIAEIRESSGTLRACAGEILRCVQVLDIYGMNVKITASGVVAFMEFADRMRQELNVAVREVLSLDETLERLDSSLSEMSRNDSLLVAECAKILPQVPDQLMRDAEALKQHQAGLVRLAHSTNATARDIRDELGLALGAIQIGDRVRQRLEHVMFGCQVLQETVTSGGLDQSGSVSVRQHTMPLLGALTAAAVEELDREGQLLVSSLHRLRDTSGQLTVLQQPDGDDTGQGFLALLESGIAQAEGMIAQFGQADRHGAATLEQILGTVDIVAAKMAAITELRLEVRNMAINIGLSCRNMGDHGKPIMVVANEIRTYSDRLDLIISTIAKAEANLLETSSRMNGKRAKGGASVDQLSQFLAVIRDCNDRTGLALQIVDTKMEDMHRLLTHAIGELDSLLAGKAGFTNMTFVVEPAKKRERFDAGSELQSLKEFFATMASNYTMKEERDIHNQHVPDFVEKIEIKNAELEDLKLLDDEDDGLF